MSGVDYIIQLVVEAKNKATAELNKIWENLDNLKSRSLQLSDSTKKAIKDVTVGATAVFWTVVAFSKSAIDSANEWNTSLEIMNTQLRNSWKSTDQAIKSLNKYVSTQSKTSVLSNDVALTIAKQAASFELSADNIERLLPALENYVLWEKWLNATTEDAETLTRWLAQALNGNFASLTRAWRVLDEETKSLIANWDETERVTWLIDVLNSQYRWLNETLAETTEWRMILLRNNLTELKQSIGQALLPVMEELVKAITPIVQKFAERVEKNPDTVAQIIETTVKLSWLVAWLWWLLLLAPKIQSAIALMTSPLWEFWIAVWVVFWAINKLEDAIISTDEQMEIYQQQIADLTAQFDAWLLSEEEYTARLLELKAQIQETQEKSMSLWQYMKDWLNEVLRDMTHIVQSSKEAFKSLWVIVDVVWGFFDSLAEVIWTFLVNAIDKAKEKIDWLISSLKKAIDLAREIWANIWGAVSDAFNTAKNRVWNATSTVKWRFWKAVWWPVYAWQQYLVWENWPEMFVPSQNWRIVRNEDLWQGWNTNINISFGDVSINDWTDQQTLAETIAETITRQLELYKKGIY